KHDFRRRRDLEIDGLAFDQFYGLLAEEPGDDEFFNLRRSGDDGGKCERRLGTYGDGDFHGSAGTITRGEHGASAGAGHDVDPSASKSGSLWGARRLRSTFFSHSRGRLCHTSFVT